MKRLTPFLLLAALAVLLAAPAGAQSNSVEWRTPLRLSEPTEIPGSVLQPGSYLVKVLDTQVTRKVVQFLTADESRVVATVLAVPNYSVRPAEGQFIYFQRSEGAPQALKAWFYPGNNYGVEFVYSKEEATKLAQTRREDVYAAETAKPETREPVVSISPELKENPVREEAPVAAAPPPPPPPPVSTTREETVTTKRPARLPKTGSPLPLLALAGLVSLGAGVSLRALARPRI